ncbi:hypothetical protein [Massilia sp. Mn16-1_5]|uniref:hypothetical protein n=1 Tax=Massilia sp. Mn16-1_5 TaxID=2079199 RepID=UPI00109EB1F1|nr:hypothetical protein [Massilia sp. Mn16-1_5]THC43985.1 hypothetical protein C2862_11875 [Massilia sp. Mn16-1_5]
MFTTTALVAGAQNLAQEQAVSGVIEYFKSAVIERWSTYRAEKFFKLFLEEIRKESDSRFESADLNEMLRQVAPTDKQSSALFDAYRRVALSASKDIGPMIIGMLTAGIVLEDRQASNDEELIFQAAEVLNDRDFDDLHKWWPKNDNKVVEADGSLHIFIKKGPDQPPGISLGRVGSGVDDVPINLARELGIFALKLKNTGLLAEMKLPRQNISVVGATQYFVIASTACQRLYELAARARSVPE